MRIAVSPTTAMMRSSSTTPSGNAMDTVVSGGASASSWSPAAGAAAVTMATGSRQVRTNRRFVTRRGTAPHPAFPPPRISIT